MDRVEILHKIKKKEEEIEKRKAAARQKADAIVRDARHKARELILKARQDAEEEARKVIREAKDKAEAEARVKIEMEMKVFSESMAKDNMTLNTASEKIAQEFLRYIREM
ncbi:MAG: hypothetical protein QW728_03595 [Thermoplasmata archaeon]